MIAITNGKILTITQGIIEKGALLVEGGRIVAVGSAADLEIPADAEVYDAGGKVVMPGLIDAHCHVSIFPDGIGWDHSDGNEMTDPITPHMRALDAFNPADPALPELVAGGVTTVLTGPGSANLIGGQWICIKTPPRPTTEEMILLEPAGMKMALGENPRRVYGDQKRTPSTRMGNAAALREALVQARNYMQKLDRYQEDLVDYENKKKEGVEPAEKVKKPAAPDRDLKLEALGPVLRGEMKARVHAHRADDMMTAIRIAEEFNLDLSLEHATEGHKIADVLASKGIPVTVGPIFINRPKFELNGLTPTNPGILARAGVKVAIQTDAMVDVKYLTINAALAVREGMPEEDALKAITINSAEIIGVADRVGSLEVGKDADVVIFSGHPFDYDTVTELVLVDGKVAYRRGGLGS
jgi:imidazolonepropionase-like amidohydrolase